jgi:tetratricopeptide (TPR) repeat protein
MSRYGIEIGVTTSAEAAARILGRPELARRYLLAALDECVSEAPKRETQAREWLLTTLNAADNDPWRTRVRKALVVGDWRALRSLAREAIVREHPPSFLVLLGRGLPAAAKSTRLELFRRIQSAYPSDLWANHWLATELQENGRPAEAVRYHTAALVLRPKNPGFHVNRGNALRDAGEVDAAIADYREALALAPGYSVPHKNLAIVLVRGGRLNEAIPEYRKYLALKPDDAVIRYNLGHALQHAGRLDQAIDEYRRAIRLKNDFAAPHFNLGSALGVKNQLDEAIKEFREAVRLQGNEALYHYGLGNALLIKAKLDEAIDEFRKAILLKCDMAEAHARLGKALRAKGQLDEAIDEFRKAILVKSDMAEAHRAEVHSDLGSALETKGQLNEAIVAYRKAIRLKKTLLVPHFGLANCLFGQGHLDEAIAKYREVIRLEKNFPGAHLHLGRVLQQKGQFRQALAALRRGHELGKAHGPRWRLPSARWVRECERLIELEGRLPDLLAGNMTPAGPAERIELAGLCSIKRLYRTVVRFYDEAFAAEPALAENLGAQHRYNAACAAALAARGRGDDAGKLTDEEAARFRRQALRWLQADRASWVKQSARDKGADRAMVQATLRHWQIDPDLVGVRDQTALANLPEAERERWQKLWSDVADMLARAKEKKSEKKTAEK